SSPLVERRAANLGIQHLIQGREDKLTALAELREIVPVELEQIAFLGDDLPDLPVMRRVGLGMAAATADSFVRQHAHGVADRGRGAGGGREVCGLGMRAQGTRDAARAAYLRGSRPS